MSIEISQRVWKTSKQYGSDKLVLLVLADHANSDGYCYPGVDRIATWAAVEERQVRRIIHSIEAHGELYIHEGGGRAGTNQYLVTVGMDRTDIVNALVRYFKQDRIASEKIADTILALRDLPNHKPSRRTKNPVLQDGGELQDREIDETLSSETSPPVLQDQNPVTQGVNPVLETPRTVINPNSTVIEPSEEGSFSKTEIQLALKASFHFAYDAEWKWLDELCAEIPDPRFLLDHVDHRRNMQSHVIFDRSTFVRTARFSYARRIHERSP